jgi:hypothetical protein
VMPELFQSCYRTTITAGGGCRAASALASRVGGFARFASVLLCAGTESVVPAAVRAAKGFRVRKDMDFRVFSWKMALEIGVAMRSACVPVKPVLGLDPRMGTGSPTRSCVNRKWV